MAGVGLLALLDDVATLLDDVAVYSKLAAKNTAGVLGDDLALNAEQVSGVRAERELPVVWAVAKGALLNKVILVPLALLISAFLPWLITPLLMLGGLFLCFEGVEKIAHKWLHGSEEKEAHQRELLKAASDMRVDIVAMEKAQIKGAIRTDFILSAEIIVIALGATQGATMMTQSAVVSVVALLATIAVYGLVAAIVKFDDAGLALIEGAGDDRWGSTRRSLGQGILLVAPKMMRLVAVVGTAAMFLVGGGILVHGLPLLHHGLETLTHGMSGAVAFVVPLIYNAVVGIIAGAAVVALFQLFGKLRSR